MRSVKKIVAAVVIAGVACQILPVEAIAAQLNTVAPPEAFGALPNDSQVQYHEEELAAFIHFGMNTFTNSEWGNGRENPNSFNPTDLNTDEWVRVLKEAGFKRVILVGKHHDGFCLWPSKVTEHDVESSTDWQASQGGNGDVLAALSESCTKYDMDMGIYLSPWDANAESYGYGTGTDDATDTNGDYNEYYMTQLREILGNPKYGNNGKFVEVWMDGAKGSGAAAQQYKFDDWFNLIEELQPGALVFSPYGTGIRWIGNESGRAGDPAWSKVNLKRIRDRYDAGYGEEQSYLNNGDPEGDIWSVGECDVSLTSGWFWHNGNGPKSMEQLTNIYFSSVGRGQPLLLNVAPDNTGNFTAEDIERLQEFAAAINNSFDENLAGQSTVTAEASEIRGNSNDYSPANVLDDDDDSYWTMDDGQTTGSLTINLGEEKVFDIVSIEEYIKLGQRISEFSVEVSSDGQNWKKFGEGYTIGAKRLVRGTPVTASQIRINIEGSLAVPLIENVEVYKADEAFEMESIVPLGTEFIDNVQFDNKDAWTQESIGINSTGMYTSSAGVHSSFTFTGTKAWVIGTLDPNHGIMEVWIDGEKVDEVDTYKATRSISQILYTTDDLAYGEHTVKIVVKGEKNAASRGQAIGLDGAYYLNNNGAGMFEIENTSYNVNEGDSIDVTIKRVGGSTGEATVHFSTSPDSAVHGRHYQDVNTIVEFADGQDTATVSIPTIDNTEKSGNLKFYCNIDTPTNSSIIGFNKKTEVTIIDNDMEQEIDEPYTEERPFIFPNKADEAKMLEAEHFTLEAIEGDKYVRITEDSQASNGKKVGWFEPGNKIKVPFFTKRAGVYTVNVTYQSGRSEGNLNKLNWSGTNVVEGSVSVPGTGNQQPIPFINTSFDIEITEAGAGELIFTADSQASPNIDFFEIVPKELEAGPHGEENPIILSDDEVIIEAETLELDGQGGEIESKDGASEGKLVGWLGKTTRGNAWLNMWLNSDKSAEYDIEVKYFAGANNVLYYENIDGSVSGSIECPTTSPNFSTVKFRVSLNEGLDRIKFFNNDASTVNIDTIKITKVEEEVVEEQTGINMTVAEEVTVGNDFDINVNLSDIKENMYAMEFEVDYDETKVDFKEATSVDADKYFVQSKATDGKVKVVVAGLGIALENVKDIVKLTFTAKASGENIAFDLINGKVADGEGAEEATKTSAVTTNIKEAVNKSELTSVIEDAKNIIENQSDKYTEATINALKEAVKLAEEVVANEGATQDQVDVAKTAVQNAIGSLEEKEEKPGENVDKTALKITIDYANELKDGGALEGVVPAVVKEFNAALAEAEALYANVNATEAEVKASFDRLTSAIHMLSFEAGDKSELENLINSANALDKDKYTEESWAKLEEVLAEANGVLADENAMQEEVNEVSGKLQQAIENLEEKPVNTVDKSILQGLVDRVEGTDSTKYIPSTWTAFANALEAANTVLSNENATQEEVDSAYSTLLRAYLSLRLTPDKSLLEGLIKEVESIDLAMYTAKSAKAVEKALKEANKVLADDEATEKEINTALANLENAKNSLVANSSNSTSSNNNSSNNNNQSSSSNNNSGTANSGSTTGNSNSGKLPQTGTAGVAGTLISGVIALLGGLGLYRKKK